MFMAKAILGAVIALVGSLVTAALTHGIDLHEWLTAILAGLVALAGIFQIPNRPPR